MIRVEVPMKTPSFNEYIDACRASYYVANNMKKGTQNDMKWFLKSLPHFEKPIKIRFIWVEQNKKRDLDNIRIC